MNTTREGSPNLSDVPPPPEGDEELVLRTLAGEPEAFAQIMRRHNRRLYRLARGIVRDDDEAEDVLQEAYLHAYQRLDTLAGKAALPLWLGRIVTNEALGRLRRRHATVALEQLEFELPAEELPLSLGHQPEAEAARRQVSAWLESAIDHLPQAFRVVFLMREIEGLSLQETATLLGIPLATVKTRDFRARRLLREYIGSCLAASFADVFPFLGARCDRIVTRVLGQLPARD